MTTSDYLYIGNTNSVDVDSAKDNGAAITTGSGSWTLYDSEDEQVATGSMTHVSGGNWQGAIPAATSLTNATDYYIDVTITASSGSVGVWRLDRKAKYRGNM